ncbi:MAG: hypothetical protein KAR35_02320 [Candidatus Heimdallarchaeota archaeon]|nr:hypothetical protein [Candidatus Heimdallarchaeota archaeon]MCK5048190.1 hypothetical protein [Candidatus Heimdallarchaeota archaeon]
MHQDVLELFVIYESIPVVYLGEESGESMEILAAGRISAMDTMGSETTGERVEIEFLEHSYFIYHRVEDFLIALRVRENISQAAANHLISQIGEKIVNNLELIKNSQGRIYLLEPLKQELDILLGGSLMTSAQGVMEIDRLFQTFIGENEWVDVIALTTMEGWAITYSTGSQLDQFSPVKLWRKATDILYDSVLAKCDGAVVTERDMLYWFRPVPLVGDETWWQLIVQVNKKRLFEYFDKLRIASGQKPLEEEYKDRLISYKSEDRDITVNIPGDVYYFVGELIDMQLLPATFQIVQPMYEKETLRATTLGFLGDFVDLIKMTSDDVPQLKASNGQLQFEFKKQASETSWEELKKLLAYQNGGKFEASIPEIISETFKTQTILCDLKSTQIKDLLEIAISRCPNFVEEQGNLFLGTPELSEWEDQIIQFREIMHPVSKFSVFGSWSFVLDNDEATNFVSILSSKAKYHFVVFEGEKTSFAYVFMQLGENDPFGFITFQSEMVMILTNRLSSLIQETEKVQEEVIEVEKEMPAMPNFFAIPDIGDESPAAPPAIPPSSSEERTDASPPAIPPPSTEPITEEKVDPAPPGIPTVGPPSIPSDSFEEKAESDDEKNGAKTVEEEEETS